MSSYQIYYYTPPQYKTGLEKMGIDLDLEIRNVDILIEEIKKQINENKEFCRDQKSIKYDYFKSLLSTDIVLYALSEDKEVLGALAFMFNIKDGDKVILFHGICSPYIYSKRGVGSELINTLIKIGITFRIKYIYLDCVGEKIKNYYEKFGFNVEKFIIKRSYDSDSDDDSDGEEDEEPHYYMKLDLSTISGGKNKKNVSIKSRKNKKTKRNMKTRRNLKTGRKLRK